MRSNFKRSLDFTLKFEGGYVNHPRDPGGHTNKGITLATYRRYKKNATVADLKNIPNGMVERIYRDGYWKAVGGDNLDPGVDGATFDYGVNSGPGTARKNLLKVVGGPAHETVKKLCARRLSIYQTFRHWKTFGKGWTRRIAAGEALWVSWALAGAGKMSAKYRVEKESKAARKTSRQQGTSASGSVAGGGGSAGVGVQADFSNWMIGGLVLAAILLTAFLIWRSHINRQRAEAYAEVAKGL